MSKNDSQFNIGDVVIKRYGSKPFTITEVYSWQVVGKFLHNNKPVYADKNSVIAYEGADKENSTPQKTLYSFEEEGVVVFGTHVGTNSKNQFILEVEGADDFVVKDPSDLEEVLPYTFSVKVNGKEVHYVGQPDKLYVGDWLIMDSGHSYSIVQVQGVNTRNKKAKTKFNGVKLITETV